MRKNNNKKTQQTLFHECRKKLAPIRKWLTTPVLPLSVLFASQSSHFFFNFIVVISAGKRLVVQLIVKTSLTHGSISSVEL